LNIEAESTAAWRDITGEYFTSISASTMTEDFLEPNTEHGGDAGSPSHSSGCQPSPFLPESVEQRDPIYGGLERHH
jgi:hypothetical protein